ncbi:MAG: hypothetical protein V4792_03485 [Pseudomonadota bacterium]
MANTLRRLAVMAGLAIAMALTGCGDDLAEAEAGVETPPPVAGAPVEIRLFVLGLDAQPIEGVRVEAVGGSEVTTTDTQGAGQIVRPSAARTLLKFSKPGYADMFESVAIQPLMTGTLVNVRMVARAAAQTLDADAGGTLVGADGSRIVLPGAALVDAMTGAAITGTVEIAITPINVSGDAIDAFPGRFRGVAADASQPMIATYGTTEFVLTQNGRRVDLAPGRRADILLPIYTPQHTPGVGVAAGDVIPLWSLDETTGMWKQEGTGTVVVADDAPTGFALSASVGHFSWWNCDIAEETGTVDVDIDTPDVDPADRDPNGPPDDGGPPPDTPPEDILDYWEKRADPNRYIVTPRLIRIDGKSSDALLRKAGIDFEAAFGAGGQGIQVDRKRALSVSYAGPRGLIVPAGRPVSLTACATVKRGGPSYPSVLACGTASVTVARNTTATVKISMKVDDPRNLPVIVSQPFSTSVEEGQTATLTVGAVRAQGGTKDITYQWSKDGVPIAGAVAASTTTPALTLADNSAVYSVVVSAPTGFTTSVPVRVLVSAPPPPPLPPAQGDRFVNAVTGSDANPGTAAAPYRSISFALTATPVGGVTWLQDGEWNGSVDPALATPSGTAGTGLNCTGSSGVGADTIRLRAVHPGGATVRYDSNRGICLRQGEVHGVRVANAQGVARIGLYIRGPGTSTLSAVALDGASIRILDGARVDITPDGLANYGHTGTLRTTLLQAQDAGTLVTVHGGAFDGLTQFGVTGTSGGCVLAGLAVISGATLVLDGVSLRADPSATATEANPSYGVHACSGGTLELRGASRVEGFTVGARIFASTLLMQASSLVGNGTGIVSGGSSGSPGTVTLAGAFVENSTRNGIVAGDVSRLTIGAGSSVRNNGNHGIAFSSTTSQLRIDGAELTGNGKLGLSYFGADCRLRNTRVDGNLEGGIVLENLSNVAPAPCDLGTAASPGGNRVLGTGIGAGLRVRTAGVAVQAVGNTWAASEQGADALGHYAVPSGQLANVISGATTSGRNVRIDAATSTVTVAQ